MGHKGVRDFTVLGDAVNVTFKLERIAATKGIDMLFSGETAQRIGKHLAVNRIGESSIDGRIPAVELYTLA